MRYYVTIFLIVMVSSVLMNGMWFAQKLPFQFHKLQIIDHFIKYQLLALMMALIVLGICLLLFPESKKWLRVGDLSTFAVKEKWLGINGKTSWLSNGFQLLIFVSIATAVFMFLGVKFTNNLGDFKVWFVPYIILFSLFNAFSEEIIFRFGVLSGLGENYPKLLVLLTSAILFGLPHYFGNPDGPIGVVMSGVLGYIICKASVETRGLGIAWTIHFVQDIIIFTAVMMMNVN